MTEQDLAGQHWRYKPNRGTGSFTVVRVNPSGRVTLRDFFGKDKTISMRTLRGDYERVSDRSGSSA